ncbi:Cellulose synthase-like protein g3 [Thalictrum thalictroides]|uniref:Cellulose synthase-like protein g3 n=1 Tax=Thalictrum thalictroides TaxID=46969 RepID=A0A7J6VYT1_THATH|nr:Cellulose synthase-like protein g3 [Thalictrum thalictroides]
MEAAKFASHWLPFCREKNIMERCPEAYFGSDHVHTWCSETEKIKIMYDNMKERVESVVERGGVGDEHITSEHDSQAFGKWTAGFTRQEHPTVIQVLLESEKDKDITGHGMPNLVYVSREKSRASPHHFKAGALNVLLRVSATMTNAPLVLTQDCDMYSNDPKTPLNALCYILDPTKASSDLAYVQFPQRYYGINKNDIYGSEIKRLFKINAAGMDGLSGPNYVGTGCFFQRRAFFGGPSSQLSAEIPELNPNHVIDKSIQSETVLKIAHSVASCNYENGTKWGSKIGFRYGSLVEDYYTGFILQCEGWRSVLCDPDRAAFLGDVPINLNDVLSQVRRWAVGLLEVSSPWLYMFLFLGAYGQDLQDFILARSTYKKWYNDQRMWMIRGVSSHSFGLIDFLLKSLSISTFGFNVTSKVVDDEQSKRYEQGLFEFGIVSPLFVPLATTAIINLIAVIVGVAQILKQRHYDEMFVHICISGFVAANSWPIYEAMVFRVDKGRMPQKITFISICFAWVLYIISFLILRQVHS